MKVEGLRMVSLLTPDCLGRQRKLNLLILLLPPPWWGRVGERGSEWLRRMKDEVNPMLLLLTGVAIDIGLRQSIACCDSNS